MEVARKDEKSRLWFRSERVFLSGHNEWYFQTREGVNIGPYESQFEAEIEAGLLKELMRGVPVNETAMGVIRDFVLDSYSMGRPLSPRFREQETANGQTASG